MNWILQEPVTNLHEKVSAADKSAAVNTYMYTYMYT